MRRICFLIAALFCLGIGTGVGQINDIYKFNGPDGATPEGSLPIVGNKIYGLTTFGGAYHHGCIFSMDTNGGNYKDLLDFNSTNGANPEGSLVYSAGSLYGMTTKGGANNCGVIFSIDTNGSTYKKLLDFDFTNGSYPHGSLVYSAGVLYGMACEGGPNGEGLIFSIDSNGNYTDILDFDDIIPPHYGSYPQGSLTISGNTLYGMTAQGGFIGYGCIFSVTKNGSGYKDIHDFTSTSTDGGNPLGDLTLSGSKLYGITQWGGQDDSGVIFSINTDGTGFKLLISFDSTKEVTNFGSLILSGSLLYGMVGYGGKYGHGNIFSIDTNGNLFTYLFNFNDTNGAVPGKSLQICGNKLYGVTAYGGANDSGVVFSFSLLCSNNFNEPICIATIDTATNKAEVIWGKTNSPNQNGYGYYDIYRDSNLGYASTHTQPLNVLSEYIDNTANLWTGPVSYELSTLDSCGESALSSPATTIFLITTSSTNAYNLSWTPYVGFTPSLYRIFRGPALNAMMQIDSVPNTVLTYVDSFPPINSFYAVEAVNPFGVCTPTTKIKPHNSMAALSGSFSNGFNTATMGVQNLSTSLNMNIYPNPSNGTFTIQSLVVSGLWTVSIYNELGQSVYSKTGTGKINEQVNLENITEGIYTVRLQTSTGSSVKKLVVMRK